MSSEGSSIFIYLELGTGKFVGDLRSEVGLLRGSDFPGRF